MKIEVLYAYLMDKVKVVATWKTYNMKTHAFETLIHQFFKSVQFHVKVRDLAGNEVEPKEWFVVPLGILSKAVESIIDGSIVDYRYNSSLQVMEKIERQERIRQGEFDTTGWKILTLNIKQVYFNQILKGEKTIEFRDLKPSTMNRYTWVDPSTGNRYLKKYDALRLCVGRNAWSDRMLVEVVNTTFDSDGQIVEYHLGKVLQVDVKSDTTKSFKIR